MTRRGAVLPAVVLAAAALLRFTGIGWGLKHRPTLDERVFVDSAWAMRVAGDLDQRFYQYPGLVMDALAVAFLPLAPAPEAPPRATLVARCLVAAFGVLSVWLVYVLGDRLVGRRAALFAAALLAVSPVEVETAHMVRPDVVLESFVLLTYLGLIGAGRSAGTKLGAGLALGAALATKLTGLLLAPVYAVGRLMAPGGSLRRLLPAFLVAVMVVVVLTPSLLMRWTAFAGGLREQWAFHYSAWPTPSSWVRLAAFYAGVVLRALGPVGATLALAGVVLSRGDLRSWFPIALFPVSMVAVLATAVVGHDRLLVPALGLLALLAAGAFDAAAERQPALATALVVTALSVPLALSILAVVRFVRPGPYDRALRWLDGHPGARVLTLNPRLGVDPQRFRRLELPATKEQRRLLALNADFVASVPDDPAVAGFQRLREPEPDPGWPGPVWPPLAFFAPGPLAPRYSPVDLGGAWLTASVGAEGLEVVRDGQASTAWSAASDAWLQVDLPAPVRLGRVTVEGSGCPDHRLWVSADGVNLTAPATVRTGPAIALEPAPVRSLRLAPAPGCPGRFVVGELRLEAASGSP